MARVIRIRSTDDLSVPQAARLLGVSRPTCYAWAWKGKLPVREVAGRLVAKRADVERLKAQLESPTAA